MAAESLSSKEIVNNLKLNPVSFLSGALLGFSICWFVALNRADSQEIKAEVLQEQHNLTKAKLETSAEKIETLEQELKLHEARKDLEKIEHEKILGLKVTEIEKLKADMVMVNEQLKAQMSSSESLLSDSESSHANAKSELASLRKMRATDEREISQLKNKISILSNNNLSLQNEREALKSQVSSILAPPIQPDAKGLRILIYMFESKASLDSKEISKALREDQGVVDYQLEELQKMGYTDFKGRSSGTSTFGISYSNSRWGISQKGREYIYKHHRSVE